MNKFILGALCLLLSACVTTPDSRPEPYLKSEELLLQGITAYKADNFSEARQKFSRALEFYRSFDNHKGIALAQLNLVETALAVSDFANAKNYLQKLKQQDEREDLEPDLKHRVSLLEINVEFEQEHYQAALTKVMALLENTKTEEGKLILWTMQARLEEQIAPLAPSSGLDKLAAAIEELKNKQHPSYEHYQIWFKRISAIVLTKRGDYQQATAFSDEALAYYKERANRRAIAACLEERANIELAQKHYPAAQDFLSRALSVRLWFKDEYKSQKIRQQLQRIHSHT